jgi:hypothetical protein
MPLSSSTVSIHNIASQLKDIQVPRATHTGSNILNTPDATYRKGAGGAKK